MKPRDVIKIGEIEIYDAGCVPWINVRGAVAYDAETFTPIEASFPNLTAIKSTKPFVIKDEEGVFHKFTGMTYEGTVAPPVSTEQMLKKLIEKFQGALVISTTNTTLVIKEDKLVVAGCGDLLKFIVEFCHHSPYVRQYGFDTFRIIGDQTTAQLRKLSTLEEDWIRNIYKEHS